MNRSKLKPMPANDLSDPVVESYGIGLLSGEMGEAQQALGNGLRFGFDTAEKGEQTSRQSLSFELGDVLASMDWCGMAGIIDWNIVLEQRQRKLRKLLDPRERNNAGGPLAPALGR